jgi:hypothetical protein
MRETQIGQPHAAAQAGITEWHRIVAESDWNHLPDLLVENVAFRNPAMIDPQHGKDTMVASLRVVFTVLQDFGSCDISPAPPAMSLSSAPASATSAWSAST